MISTKAKELISSLITDAAWSVGVTSPNLKSKTDLEGYIEGLEEALKAFVNWKTNEEGTLSLVDDEELWKRAEEVLKK